MRIGFQLGMNERDLKEIPYLYSYREYLVIVILYVQYMEVLSRSRNSYSYSDVIARSLKLKSGRLLPMTPGVLWPCGPVAPFFPPPRCIFAICCISRILC